MLNHAVCKIAQGKLLSMPRNPEIGPLGVEPLEKVRLVTKISTM
jgi:hypothetical protein